MENKDLFNKAKGLNLPRGSFAIFGSGPMSIRGLRESWDLDIIVKETERSVYLENGNIELWKDWGPDWSPTGQWNIKKLIAEAEIIDGLPFVRLEEVLKWKNMLRREKDIADIKILENYLKNL